jgi:putative flippase GtrA
MVSQLIRKLTNNSVLKFGLVGIFATLTYYYSAIFLREVMSGYPIVITNLIAYCIAMFVSYVGHYFWTYKAQSSHGATSLKFIASALFGSALNSAIVQICMYSTMQYRSAMVVAIILVPAVAYVINKRWVFISDS